MFETIAQSSPDDYQALEILKEAYWKIGRQADSLIVAQRLADTYRRLGQYSSALLEYEGVLQQNADSPEADAIKEILQQLEAKLYPGKTSGSSPAIALDFGVHEGLIALDDFGGTGDAGNGGAGNIAGLESWPTAPAQAQEPSNLIATPATKMPRNLDRKPVNISLEADGNEPLAKFLIQHRLATHEVVNSALARVREQNASPEVTEGRAIAASLLHEIAAAGVEIDPLLLGIIDRTKFPYAPLEYYDVDRQIVKMLPENLTLGRLVVPFDIMSRTMMVAVDNPFDTGAKTAVQQSVDYHIQWHLARPQILQKILREVYRIS